MLLAACCGCSDDRGSNIGLIDAGTGLDRARRIMMAMAAGSGRYRGAAASNGIRPA